MKKVLSLLLAIFMVLSLAGCAGAPTPSETASPSPSPSAEPVLETPSAAPSEPAEKLSVKAGFLKGPTGIGASYLMAQNEKGETELDYAFTVESDPSIMMGEIIAGSVDIAAVPTNVAAALYNKTGGGVQFIAVNTLSVLYILENGDTVRSMSDLRGKTLYAIGQGSNPEYVLNHLLGLSGVVPGVDITVEYVDPAELATKMAAGEVTLCMLPVPNATSVLMKNGDVRAALDLGAVWEEATGGSKLTQGCVVVRTDLENKDAVVGAFLKDYGASVAYMADPAKLEDAAKLAFKYEMVGSEAVAKAAIPDCNMVFITGAADIKDSISEYFSVLFKADPKSLGGAIPDDAFYYGG